MPTSYTSLIGLALPVTGELSGTWGDTVNNYITNYLDSAVAGTQTISGTQTAVTLSVTNGSSLVTAGSGSTGSAQFQIINCTGNPAGLLTITAPASSRQYIIINATSTSQSVKIVGTGPTTGVTLIAGEKAHVAWNGSDFVKIATTAAAGGSNTQVQYNSSGVLAGSSNMTFDGTNLTVGGTASATKLIPTGGAATGNGMYLPAANTLAWSNNGSETMRLDSSGNLGLGVTPSAWSVPAGKIIEVGTVGNSIWGIGASNMVVGSNIYYASSSYKYANTGSAASAYQQAGGVHYWYNAASGTAGNIISFTQAMTLDSSGNLGIGTTSPTAALDISKASFIGGPLIGARFNTSNLRMGIGIGNTNGFPFLGVNVNNAANDNGTFDISNWASRIRLDNGVFQVQTSSASGTAGNAITWNTPLYLDSSGNLLLGGTSTTQLDGVFGQLIGSSSKTSAGLALETQYGAYLIYTDSADALIFWDSGSNTERARITSGGDLLVGTTTSLGKLTVEQNLGGVGDAVGLKDTGSSYGSGAVYINFKNNAGSVAGKIEHTASTTVNYNTSSDARLKTDIGVATDTSVIDQIVIHDFEWKEDGQIDRGVFAQEAHQIKPSAVSVGTDEVNEKGVLLNPWGVDYSKFVPDLIVHAKQLKNTVKEQQALIEQLTARIAALESKGA